VGIIVVSVGSIVVGIDHAIVVVVVLLNMRLITQSSTDSLRFLCCDRCALLVFATLV